MSKQIAEAKCQIKADSSLVANLFEKLKKNQISIKRIELMENPRDNGRFFLHLEADIMSSDALRHTSLEEIIRQACKEHTLF